MTVKAMMTVFFYRFSEAEPKGSDCIEKFVAMQDCMKDYPKLYDDNQSPDAAGSGAAMGVQDPSLPEGQDMEESGIRNGQRIAEVNPGGVASSGGSVATGTS